MDLCTLGSGTEISRDLKEIGKPERLEVDYVIVDSSPDVPPIFRTMSSVPSNSLVAVVGRLEAISSESGWSVNSPH